MEQLKAFVAVADTDSYSSGSRKISRDRTTIREHIDNLQVNLNAELVNKTGHEYYLTDFGEIYFRGKQPCFSAFKFEKLIKSFNNGKFKRKLYNLYL